MKTQDKKYDRKHEEQAPMQEVKQGDLRDISGGSSTVWNPEANSSEADQPMQPNRPADQPSDGPGSTAGPYFTV